MNLLRSAAIGLAAFLCLLAAPPPAIVAASPILYVDGKSGSDTNDGRSPERALKSISRAALLLPAGSTAAGWAVEVRGYTDYVYRERPIPSGWDRKGAAGAPIVFRAAGYGPSRNDYVRPIVSGANTAPTPGERWSPTSTPGVWRTPWSTRPFGYGSMVGSLRTALFQDETTWLWEQASLAALVSRAAVGTGGYWYDATGKWLYASAVGTGAERDPSTHAIEVIRRNGFYFDGRSGVRYVEVRGFDVRHSANGIAFVKGVDYGVAADNVVLGNLMMGIQASGGQTPSGPNPAVGITIWRNRGTANTLQAIKIDEGTQKASVCHNDLYGNGLQGIKIQGPPGGTGYSGTTSGITVCANQLHGNNYNPTGSTYNNASGITIANGARSVTVDSNRIWGNDVGIFVTQESTGRKTITGIVTRRNLVTGNRRFGLYLFDGYKGSAAGAGILTSSYDVYADNGIGVMVGRGTSHKSLYKGTIYGNRGDGIRIGEAGRPRASLTVSRSLITSNRGYGVWNVTGSSARVSYTGLTSNAKGSAKGVLSKLALNHRAAGYLSTSPSSGSQYLRIGRGSYQYTAGPSHTPIGARY